MWGEKSRYLWDFNEISMKFQLEKNLIVKERCIRDFREFSVKFYVSIKLLNSFVDFIMLLGEKNYKKLENNSPVKELFAMSKVDNDDNEPNVAGISPEKSLLLNTRVCRLFILDRSGIVSFNLF